MSLAYKQRKNARYQAKMLQAWPDRHLSAAELMDGEMPEGFTSSNRAAGPTETELAKAEDALDELDRRRWEAEWGEASR